MYQSTIREAISYGSLAGQVTTLRLIGFNGAITSSAETIWDESTAYTFLAANMSAPTISSDSANDTAAGTGARTVLVSGVDSNYAIKTETATLNGQTEVALTNSYMAINSLTVVTAGSGGVNAGIIYVGTGSVTAGKPAVVHALMAAGRNKSTSFIYTVPANYTLLMTEVHVASRSTTAGGHQFQIDEIIDAVGASGLKTMRYINGFTNTNPLRHIPYYPLNFAAKTQLQGTVLASAGTGPAVGYADCLLINNSTQLIF